MGKNQIIVIIIADKSFFLLVILIREAPVQGRDWRNKRRAQLV